MCKRNLLCISVRFFSVNDDEFDWQGACAERELQQLRWSNVAHTMEYFTFKEGLYGAVDTVHLMQVIKHCIMLIKGLLLIRELYW